MMGNLMVSINLSHREGVLTEYLNGKKGYIGSAVCESTFVILMYGFFFENKNLLQ